MKRNILITGAAGNLGRSVVEEFLSQGDQVIAVVSPGKSSEYPARPGMIVAEADLTNEQSVDSLIAGLIKNYHNVDAALLLVGGYASGGLQDTDGALLRKMYALNFETAYFVARPVFAAMMKQSAGGRIVFVGARPALQPRDGKNSLAYALAKSLIFKLADFLNAEGASKNVLSTVIIPSTIDTSVNRKAMPDADFSAWVKPEAIAALAAFAVSEKATPLRDAVLKIYGKA